MLPMIDLLRLGPGVFPAGRLQGSGQRRVSASCQPGRRA
jgi:hypothetical protein